GFLSVLMSSSELIEEEYEDIYGGLFAGLLLGQELKLWRFTLGVNLLAGAGGSVSTLRRSPRHMDFFGEINIELGVMIVRGFQIAASAGFQCTGNLFPELPGTDYFLYYPVWGMTFSF
ncbi:MAG: hypothetical protein JXJ04_18245, partial [Spirochaetales bacterium]|nr:hypothetical protein [Spirochaetales bacterium]